MGVLPRSGEGAAAFTDFEVRKLAMAIWRDVAIWAEGEGDAKSHLAMFRGERSNASPEASDGSAEKIPDWVFVPATELLLIIGDGTVGCNAEGLFSQADEGHKRRSFTEALRHWRTNIRKDSGKDTSASAVDLWRSKSKDQEQKKTDDDGPKGKRQKTTETGSKAASIDVDEPEVKQAKLNRSPTKVVLLTNFAAPGEAEDLVRTRAEDLMKKFGKLKTFVMREIAGAPDKDAVRVFLEFEKLQTASKVYAGLNGTYIEGRAVKARFYDEDRFAQGDLERNAPTKVLLLNNLADPGDLDGLQEEVEAEAKKFGFGRCIIVEKQASAREVRGFLEFKTTEEALKAFKAFEGRDFHGRKLKARFYSEQQFAAGEL